MSRRAVVLACLCTVGISMPLFAQNASPRVATSETSDGAARGMARVRFTVATRALQRGDTLRATDIAVVDTSIVWRWNTPPDTTRAQPGWITRRTIAAGEVLRSPAVGAAPIVKAGSQVKVIYQDGPVRILLTGIATSNAALGAPVGVRIDANRRLDGIAVAANTVRLH
jgi:flagella basal body P-ring formation protein FlgA